MTTMCGFYTPDPELAAALGQPHVVTTDGHLVEDDSVRFLVPVAKGAGAVSVQACERHLQLLERLYAADSGDPTTVQLGIMPTPAQLVHQFLTSTPAEREEAMTAREQMRHMVLRQQAAILAMQTALSKIAHASGALTEIDDSGAINVPARIAAECLAGLVGKL